MSEAMDEMELCQCGHHGYAHEYGSCDHCSCADFTSPDEPPANHVVLERVASDRSRFVCLRCGRSWSFEMPVSVSVLAGASKPYADLHRYCEPKKSEVPHE